MGRRPYFQKSIVELERLFRDAEDDVSVLQRLADELAHRTTQRACALAQRVEQRLQALSESVGAEEADPETKGVGAPSLELNVPDLQEPAPELSESVDEYLPGPPVAQSEVSLDGLVQPPQKEEEFDWDESPVDGAVPPDIVEPPERSDPSSILDVWTALEVLSPQTYVRPEDLADGDVKRVARFGEGRPLPWVRGPEKAPKNTKLYYQVILGALPIDRATTALLKAFGDNRPERPLVRGYAALASITVDQEGRPIAGDAIAVSSFGWGYKLAREGRLAELKTWPQIERRLIDELEKRLKRDEDDEVLPLDEGTISGAFRWLCDEFGSPEDERVAPSFAIRLYRWLYAPGDPEPLLLNSFFLEDLARARGLHNRSQIGPALASYLGLNPPEKPIDLLQDRTALEQLLAPSCTPAARWPSPGGRSLVLLQQAAVNAALTRLGSSSGIISVNGPPGTGKTTLLRDLVAAIVLERARVLANFDDPERAFRHQGRVRRGGSFIHLYELDQTIRGHEILVASSNNKAVENISRELPGRDAIEPTQTPDYFPTTAAAVAGEQKDAWGMIAGVLGNAANRAAFRKGFWLDGDAGLRVYLWAAAGKDPKIQRTDPETGAITLAAPRVVLQDRPPRNKEEALQRWRRARRQFREALRAAEIELQKLEDVRGLLRRRMALRDERPKAERRVREAASLAHTAREAHLERTREADVAANEGRCADRAVRDHQASRPGFLSRILRTRKWRAWADQMADLQRTRGYTIREAEAASRRRAEAERFALQLESALASAEDALSRLDAELHSIEQKLEEARQILGDQLADEGFWNAPHEKFQVSTPWLTEHVQRKRDACFVSALELHRAFIDAAAKPIRHNLNALFGVLMGDGLDGPVRSVLPSLWSTLFLVVPVISTTFASVTRMLGPMPPESLGWLLVDEAGQALPQAAVGALMRSRRAVIVGDPLQIEPVVTLPLSLVERIALRMSVDPATWTAPKASAQTLADDASPYQSTIEQIDGSIRVGAPLLVHQRCAEPMFGISNAVAYAGNMVMATKPRPSKVKVILGPSRWFHVAGTGYGKWCPEEGELVGEALRQLINQGLRDPDVFVITPFRIVAQKMRELLAKSDAVKAITEKPWHWVRDRVGTVHTFQGRQAEAVFFVLGAPEVTQTGARNWAGYPPNLANVAVTRAKEVLYVVGNRDLWQLHGSFRIVSERLP